MNSEQFWEYKHEAIHDLQSLNENCEREFRITSWPRWHYDLDAGTLTFSEGGVPKVVASIQVVGTTSQDKGTWLWGWANSHLPAKVTEALSRVRAFGEAEGLTELTSESLPDDEYLGWDMTAVAAKILGATGAYRCPVEDGFVYLVYFSLQAVTEEPKHEAGNGQVICTTHGAGFSTYVCEHLLANPAQKWFSSEPSEEIRWPDAWCASCNAHFQEEGEWNDRNQAKLKIQLLCHYCYERLRSKESHTAGSP